MQVTTKRAQQWCASKGELSYFETSAKDGANVEQAFQRVAELALAQENDADLYNEFPDHIALSNTPAQPTTGRDCGC